MITIGIDPGTKGGLVSVKDGKRVLEMLTMPYAGDELDVLLVRDWIQDQRADWIFLERVASMPRDGAKSAFSFGKSFGALLACLKLLGMQHELLAPSKWQGIAHESRSKVMDPKERSLMAVRRLFPKESFVLPRCRVPHDGLVDAACIAWAGWHQMHTGKKFEQAGETARNVTKAFDREFCGGE